VRVQGVGAEEVGIHAAGNREGFIFELWEILGDGTSAVA
jgi:hypothetical protein